jgi:hypothetical protein
LPEKKIVKEDMAEGNLALILLLSDWATFAVTFINLSYSNFKGEICVPRRQGDKRVLSESIVHLHNNQTPPSESHKKDKEYQSRPQNNKSPPSNRMRRF